MIEKIGHIRNPLTVVGIFAAIAEVSGTVVLPFIDTSHQGTYVWFLMLFPVFLVAVFFITLNFNNKVLYAPSDYRDDKSFLDGLRIASESANDLSNFNEDISKTIKEFLTSPKLFEDLKNSDLDKGLKKAAEELSEEIRESSFFTVHLSPFVKNADPKTYPISLFRKFNGLTDAVYFAMNGAVKPFTYGKEWVLRDKHSGRILKHARMVTNAGFGMPVDDKRTLKEMGIKPGAELEVVVPPSEQIS